MPPGLNLPLPSPALAGGMPLYVTGEDAIRLTAFNAAAGVTLALTGRFLPIKIADNEPDPRVGPFNHSLVPATDRTASITTQVLGEGWLLDWSVVATAGTPAIGQCYAVVTLTRGSTGNVLELSTLGQGYVTRKKRLGWPGGQQMDFLDGGGALRSIAGAVPGAGAEVSETVPTGARWDLLAIRLLLTAAAAVANRVVRLVLDDGANVYWEPSTGFSQTATSAIVYSGGQGAAVFAPGGDFRAVVPLPDNVRMGAGHRLRTSTLAIQGADQYSAIQYLVREWIEGA